MLYTVKLKKYSFLKTVLDVRQDSFLQLWWFCLRLYGSSSSKMGSYDLSVIIFLAKEEIFIFSS